MTELLDRAHRAASRLPDGPSILALVTAPQARKALVLAAEAGKLPLASLCHQIRGAFPEAVKDLRVRQMIGLAVAGVMAEAGFVTASPRRLLADCPPFRFGATYRRPETGEGPGLVARLVAALSDEEAREAHRLLALRIGSR